MSIPKECKRLAEVDFPIAVVSKHAAREKSIRHGHPSTLHLWWARRPLASSRAVLLALLLPDPCDPNCPKDFKEKARILVGRVQRTPKAEDLDLRKGLLRFIGDFANWDLASNPDYIAVGRGLVKAAHGEEAPLVVDPFAGGGSIPLEALRLGCEAFASDLNPVACLILKVMLEDIPRYGPKLATELRRVGAEIKSQAEKELADLYPRDADGATPIAYLWARTVRCESPGCGAEIPLARSFWLCEKTNRMRALRYHVLRPTGGPPRIELEVFEPKDENEVFRGTVSSARATCVACGSVLPQERVRSQLATQHGGADVVFGNDGNRAGGARLLAVVTMRPPSLGRSYRLPNQRDYDAIRLASQRVSNTEGTRFPNEPIIQGKVSKNSPFRMHLYGCRTFGDLFSARQKLALAALQSAAQNATTTPEDTELFALCLGKAIRHWNAFAKWHRGSETVAGAFGLQAISMSWDYPEMSPFSGYAGGLDDSISDVIDAAEAVKAAAAHPGEAQLRDACEQCLPNGAADCWFTDPPYYDAIPYADISDAFYSWHKRTLAGDPILANRYERESPLTPKERELIQDDNRQVEGRFKDRHWFEERIADAFSVGRVTLSDDGVGCVVFAHKTTEGWEALLSGMTAAGWTVTSSWPIATERGARLRARDSAALATSVHLVCRPRPAEATIGDWADVLRELPRRVAEWMDRLQSEGIRGADLVFACIGPALEIYSRYSKVVDPEEREIPLGGEPEATEPHKRGYLAYVWEAVGRAALEQVLGTAEGKARNGMAGVLEEDARLTALFLWTLQNTNGGSAGAESEDARDEAEEDVEEEAPPRAKAGFSLIYDVARRFAQPLGIHLEDWEGRIIETDKGVVRLLPVRERARQLFGEDGAEAVASELERDPARAAQLALFPDAEAPGPAVRGRGRRRRAGSSGGPTDEALAARRREATTLDRVHAAMLLQAGGKTNALRNLLKAEQERSPDFLRLANALSALYPKENEEKRLLDAMLLGVPR
jgi:putative DNA methylase